MDDQWSWHHVLQLQRPWPLFKSDPVRSLQGESRNGGAMVEHVDILKGQNEMFRNHTCVDGAGIEIHHPSCPLDPMSQCPFPLPVSLNPGVESTRQSPCKSPSWPRASRLAAAVSAAVSCRACIALGPSAIKRVHYIVLHHPAISCTCKIM